MEIFVIYNNPTDYPGSFVVRRFENLIADEVPIIVTTSLINARFAVPIDKICIARDESDDKCIIESWL